jgi:hypothetical protein
MLRQALAESTHHTSQSARMSQCSPHRRHILNSTPSMQVWGKACTTRYQFFHLRRARHVHLMEIFFRFDLVVFLLDEGRLCRTRSKGFDSVGCGLVIREIFGGGKRCLPPSGCNRLLFGKLRTLGALLLVLRSFALLLLGRRLRTGVLRLGACAHWLAWYRWRKRCHMRHHGSVRGPKHHVRGRIDEVGKWRRHCKCMRKRGDPREPAPCARIHAVRCLECCWASLQHRVHLLAPVCAANWLE